MSCGARHTMAAGTSWAQLEDRVLGAGIKENCIGL